MATTILMGGCAHWRSDDTPAELSARHTLKRLQAANTGLLDCKGLGQVSLRTGTQTQRARLAWAARVPDKLRLELLAVSGHPLATLASDGAHLYLRDTTTDRFHKNNSPAGSLERLVKVPLRVPDLIAYLMGRIPVTATERIEQMDNLDEPGYILESRRWWGEPSQRIYLDLDGRTIRQVVNYSTGGDITYQVDLSDHRKVGDFRFARRISASTPRGNRIDIRLERFWTNTGIEEGAFQLTR